MKYILTVLFTIYFANSYSQGFPPAGNPLTGGSAQQILMKNSGTSYDWAWSTYFGTSSVTTVGTIGTGTWQGTAIGSTYGGTGVNNAGRTLTINTNGGTLDFTGTSKTLTVPLDASVSGSNTGDNATNTQYSGLAASKQDVNAKLTSISALANASGFLKNDGSGNFSYDNPAGSGTVTDVSVVTANGISGSVATSTSTPAITLTLGAIIPSSVDVSNTDATITRTGAGQIAVEGKGIVTTVKTTVFITGTAATFTPQTGMVYAEVWCTGQGGGGGGSRASDASSAGTGSGGGAGGTAYILYTAAEMGANATYTVGTAAGAGGSNIGGNGTAGSNSTFDPAGTGATLTGTGGGLGTGVDNATPALSTRDGGAGGVPTGGLINLTGGAGGGAGSNSIVTVAAVSGGGGGSYWGGGGGIVTSASTAKAGVAGAAYGSGGSGSASINSSGGAVGGNGAVGVIVIKEYIQ